MGISLWWGKVGKEDKKMLNDVENFRKIDPNKPMVALTFDDGHSNITHKVLDILENNGYFT